MNIEITQNAIDFILQTALNGKCIRIRAYDTYE